MDDLDAQIERVMQEKVILQSQEMIKALGLEYWRFITANAQRGGEGFGSPVLSGRFYRSHNISLDSPNTKVEAPNPGGAERPYSAQPLSIAAVLLNTFTLGRSIFFANALPYSRRLETGYSAKAPDGVYQVAADLLRAKAKNVRIKVGK